MVADARHRQPAEDVLHQRRSALRRGDVPGQGLPLARPGSDLRRRHPAAPRRRAIASTDGWRGDVVAPMIRDLGRDARDAARSRTTVRMVLSAQMAKAGPPMNGKDLHIGDFESRDSARPSRRSASGALTMAGMAMAFAREGQRPASRCRSSARAGPRSASGTRPSTSAPSGSCRRSSASQNNQTALSTPVSRSVRRPGVRRQGRRLRHPRYHYRRHRSRRDCRGVRVGGRTRARRRRSRRSSSWSSMRMCGHAHHDDMLYLGKDPQPSWEYPPLFEQGYANRERYAFWAARDPIPAYAARLDRRGPHRRGGARSPEA